MSNISTKIEDFLKENNSSNESLFSIDLKMPNRKEYDSILNFSESIISSLDSLVKQVKDSKDVAEDDKEFYINNLNDIIVSFEKIEESATKKEDLDNISEYLNKVLEDFYHLSDTKLITTDNKKLSFLSYR